MTARSHTRDRRKQKKRWALRRRGTGANRWKDDTRVNGKARANDKPEEKTLDQVKGEFDGR